MESDKRTTYIYVLVCCGLIIASLLYITIPLTGNSAGEYKASIRALNMLTSVYAIGYATGFVIWGLFSNRIAKVKLLYYGLSLTLLTMLLLIVVNNIYMAIAIRFFQGLFAACFVPMSVAWISAHYDRALRLKGLSWISTTVLIAGVFGQIIGGMFSMKSILIVFAVILTICILRIKKFPDDDGVLENKSSGDSLLSSVVHIFGDSNVLKLYSVSFVHLASFVALYSVMTNNYAGNPGALNMRMLKYIALPFMTLPLFVEQVMHKFNEYKAASYTLIAAGMAYALHFVYFFADDLNNKASFILYSAHILYIASIALSLPPLLSIASTIKPRYRGVVVSFYSFILYAGASIGSGISVALEGGVVLSIYAVLLLMAGVAINTCKSQEDGLAENYSKELS